MTDASWSVGLMTGTVLDGEIDVALLRTDGDAVFEFGPIATCRYSDSVCGEIRQAVDDATEWDFNGPQPASFAIAERSLTEAQANAVIETLDQAGLQTKQVSAIGFHGQTVLHRPPRSGASVASGIRNRCADNDVALVRHSGSDCTSPTDQALCGQTLQLGNGDLLANLTNTTVVHDFRTADMRHAGQGAPLVPVYHQALLKPLLGQTTDLPALVNLGGIGNITWWDGQDLLVAFDTGPANAPINDWVASRGAGSYDKNGCLAARGCVDDQRLQKVLQHPFFAAHYPKSIDRQDFTAVLASALDGMSLEDGAAFLVAVCAGAIARALTLLPKSPGLLVLCGGGRHNQTLAAEIERRSGCDVELAEAFAWRGDAMEAECFAFLAERVLRHRPTSFPTTTGCHVPVCGGTVSRP